MIRIFEGDIDLGASSGSILFILLGEIWVCQESFWSCYLICERFRRGRLNIKRSKSNCEYCKSLFFLQNSYIELSRYIILYIYNL